jgi:parallel beta-helix repeat protein
VTFAYEGAQAAHVVKVASGQIDLRRCGFSGGIRDEAAQRGGVGLLLVGQVRGTIAECEASRNEHHGICVCRQAQPVLEGNTCEGNAYSGIAYFGTAAGCARNNTCHRNQQDGIYVGEQAQPVLEGNTCEGNKEDGIYVALARTATFSGATNHCRGNKRKDINDQRPWYRRGRC